VEWVTVVAIVDCFDDADRAKNHPTAPPSPVKLASGLSDTTSGIRE
jgi:hypothetical protein